MAKATKKAVIDRITLRMDRSDLSHEEFIELGKLYRDLMVNVPDASRRSVRDINQAVQAIPRESVFDQVRKIENAQKVE